MLKDHEDIHGKITHSPRASALVASPMSRNASSDQPLSITMRMSKSFRVRLAISFHGDIIIF
jgi:hypothetical protein